jgi:hypothetical protein
MMLNKKFSCEVHDSLTDKVSSLIIGQAPRIAKIGYYILKNKVFQCVYKEILKSFFFIPTSQVIGCSNNVSLL